MVSGVVLIFGVPMVFAAVVISPTGFHALVHGVLFNAILRREVAIRGALTTGALLFIAVAT